MAKKAKNKSKNKNSKETPEQRGCYSCNRWDTFMKKVWEAEQELCPKESCYILLNNCLPDTSESE